MSEISTPITVRKRQEHQERAGQIHVLALQRLDQQRPRCLQRQHDRNDLRAGNDGGRMLPMSAMKKFSDMRNGYFISP